MSVAIFEKHKQKSNAFYVSRYIYTSKNTIIHGGKTCQERNQQKHRPLKLQQLFKHLFPHLAATATVQNPLLNQSSPQQAKQPECKNSKTLIFLLSFSPPYRKL